MSALNTNEFLLRNARIVQLDTVADADLLITGDQIQAVGDRKSIIKASGVKEIDLSGCTLFPGFIDIHIHGAAGIDTMNADAAGLMRVSEFLAKRGVTAWLPTLVPSEAVSYQRAISAIQEATTSRSSARILGVHYEGPFVSSAQCGALHPQNFRTFSDPSDLDALPVFQGAAIKMMTIAPEIKGGMTLVKALNERGWVTAIGHTRAAPAVLDQAFDAGARHMTHFMNAMAPFHHRSPGPVGWGLLRSDVTCDLIADGVHLDPYTLRLLLQTKGPDLLILISDAIAAAGLGDGEYKIWDESIFVERGRTRNQHGNIAGSVISILDAARLLRSLGASEVALARMSATNPAKLLGIENTVGSIAQGKRADLVALDKNDEVVLVMVGGLPAISPL